MARYGRAGTIGESRGDQGGCLVTPAEGPSFGIAPPERACEGRNRRRSSPESELVSLSDGPRPSHLHRLLHYLADLTGYGNTPLPHGVGFDEEHVAAHGVQARPTVHGAFRTLGNFAFSPNLNPPRNSCTICGVTTSFSLLPRPRRRACLRQIVPIVRSRLRTPASRV